MQPAWALQCEQRCCFTVLQNTFITIEYDFCTYLLLLADLHLRPQAQFTCVQHRFTVIPVNENLSQRLLPPSLVRNLSEEEPSLGSGMTFGAVATFERNGISF